MSFKVAAADARSPWVVGLDVGSTGTRGGLFDATGLPIDRHRHRVAHEFTTASDGTCTIDADQVVDEVSEVLDTVLAGVDAGSVAGVAIDTFSSSLVGVDADGGALTPVFTYADSRCAPQVAELRRSLDEEATQQRTGTRFHSSYLPARFAWLNAEQPELVKRVHRWLSLSEYVLLRLLGVTAAGTSVAAWTGLLDRRRGVWDEELLRHVGVPAERLSPVHNPDQVLRPETGGVGERWPALADAVWLPGISDGFASNLGTGADDDRTMVVSTATSGAMRVLIEQIPDTIPGGLWCYRVDERRSLLGGALNDVGRAVSWLRATLQLPGDEELERALLADPVATTALVLPFLTGERSTGWAGGARAVFTGVSAGQSATDLFRATLEGVALSYARLAGQLRQLAGDPERILASGRVSAEVPGLLQLLADSMQAPVAPITIKRSTLHGTALLALGVVAPDVPRAEVSRGDTCRPVPGRAAYYADRLAEFERVYRGVIG